MEKFLIGISDLANSEYGKNQKYQVNFLPPSPDPKNIKITKPIVGEVQLTNLNDFFLGQINLEVTLSLKCSRCAKNYQTKQKIEITKKIKNKNLIEHKYINLTPIINEEIIINLPIKPLCSIRCKGLCQMCGANKNKSKCSCKIENTDKKENPFAKLKTIIDKENNGRTKKEIN